MIAWHKKLLRKCQEQGLKVSSQARKYTLKRKLMDIKVDLDDLTKNESNQTPRGTLFSFSFYAYIYK